MLQLSFDVYSDEVKRRGSIINDLPKKLSTGEDQISYADIKDCENFSVKMMTFITNEIIATKFWPRLWTNSIIKALFKGGKKKTDSTAYRPISLTSAVSLVVERI